MTRQEKLMLDCVVAECLRLRAALCGLKCPQCGRGMGVAPCNLIDHIESWKALQPTKEEADLI